MMGVDDDLTNPFGVQPVQDVRQERPIPDRHERLCADIGERP
jgi:hypothetical protein